MISFFPIIFKKTFRVALFAHLLTMFSRFYPDFWNLGIRSKEISQALTIIRKSFLTNSLSKCGLNPSLFQLPLTSTLFSIWFCNLCQFLYINFYSITKTSWAISMKFWTFIKIDKRFHTTNCHILFPPWKQT